MVTLLIGKAKQR